MRQRTQMILYKQQRFIVLEIQLAKEFCKSTTSGHNRIKIKHLTLNEPATIRPNNPTERTVRISFT